MKRIEELLKKLFDYQKFDSNSKLEQTIMDSRNDSFLINDLELSNVTGAGYTKYEKCPQCNNNSLKVIYSQGYCSKHCDLCNFDEFKKV